LRAELLNCADGVLSCPLNIALVVQIGCDVPEI